MHGIKRRTQKLGHDILRYLSKFWCSEYMIIFYWQKTIVKTFWKNNTVQNAYLVVWKSVNTGGHKNRFGYMVMQGGTRCNFQIASCQICVLSLIGAVLRDSERCQSLKIV